ncbi:MAG: branched-chain amino acid ABC transporter permease [Chloroflexi bacterium]|nr:branched-chain amino acid ABC transporter permease [Chloroflexota bacterium]
MESFQFVVNGLMLGGIYAIVGAGFALVYGVMNVLNVAHGSFIMIGAYLTYWTVTLLGVDPFVTLPASAVALFAFGYLVQRTVISRVLHASIFMTFILTFGLDMFLINAGLVAWGGSYRAVRPSYADDVLIMGGLTIPYVRLVVLVAVVAVIALLLLFMSKTRLGIAIKATALEREAAQLAGVDVKQIDAITFGLSAALAGVAGGLLAVVLPFGPFMGVPLTGKAFTVAVLGGLGSMTGALYGGFVLAFAEIGGVIALGGEWADGIAFIILLVVLVLRPRGLLGKEFFAEVKV